MAKNKKEVETSQVEENVIETAVVEETAAEALTKEQKLAKEVADLEAKMAARLEKAKAKLMRKVEKEAEATLSEEEKAKRKAEKEAEKLAKAEKLAAEKAEKIAKKNLYDPRYHGEDAPFFPVSLSDIAAINATGIEGNVGMVTIPSRKAVVDIANKSIVAINSDLYQLVSNKEVIDAALDAAKVIDSEVTVRSTWCDGKRFRQHLVFPNVKIVVGTLPDGSDDEVAMENVVENSYDGSKKVGFSLGGLREVCTNGLKVYKSEFEVNEKHLKSTLDKEAFIEGIQAAIENFTSEVKSQWELWNQTELSEEQIDEIFAKANARMSKKYVEEIQDDVEDLKQKQVLTAWIVFNAFTRFFTHSPKVGGLRSDRFNTEASRIFQEMFPAE